MSTDDSYCPPEKQHDLLSLILYFYSAGKKAVESGADIDKIAALPVRERIGRAKSTPTEGYKKEYAAIKAELDAELAGIGGEDE